MILDDLRAELIQVAAVAIAAITDMDQGHTKLTISTDGDLTATEQAIVDIAQERHKQEVKGGTRSLYPGKWLIILGEEVGEAADDAIELHGSDLPEGVLPLIQAMSDLGRECKAWLDERLE